MGKKKIEQGLRDAGLRKKHASDFAKAADRSRAGDRAARELVEVQSAALRDSVSAVVRYAKPPASRPATKRSPARSTARSKKSKSRTSKETAATG
jgi:hypothetical protein